MSTRISSHVAATSPALAPTHVVEPAASEELVGAWRQRLPGLVGAERAGLLVTLAWHLRQRDPAQAGEFAREALTLCAGCAPRTGLSLEARLHLVRGEHALLDAGFDGARLHATEALELFARADDAAGTADAHALVALLENDLGRHTERDAAMLRARAAATTAADPLRLALVDAVIAYNAAIANNGRTEPHWVATLDAQLATGIPVVVVHANDLRSVMAFHRGEYGQTIPWLRDQLEAARQCGLVRKQVTTTANLSMAFFMLNDLDTALDWAQASLDLARRTGWPTLVATALCPMAQVLDALGQSATAHAMVDESLTVLAPFGGSYLRLAALAFKGRLALQQGDAATALRASDELEELSRGHYGKQFSCPVRFNRARALALLERATEAEQCALEALATAEAVEEPHAQIDALELLASLHERFPLAPPASLQAANAPLHYLLRALSVAAGIPGFRVPGHLFSRLAEQHAQAGDPARAYACALDAATAREATHGREVRDRAMAAQMRHEAERARAELEHHRRVADIELQRSRALQSTLSELRAAQDELLRRNEVQARMHTEREETLAFLAHDLRAPLAALIPVLHDGVPRDAGRRAERLAERALAMTDRFLAIARLSHLPPAERVPLDLASLVDAACETFERRALDEDRSLEQDLVFGVTVAGHRESLMRAICNLVDNALTHSPPGGHVEVSMAARGLEAAVIVADDGPGLPIAARQVLVRATGERSAFAGGRLGLAIVAEVARVHAARIEVDAGPQGTRIAFWLPLVAA
ncbi:MAG TPA: ATP-binding protein [Burkholderiaceae bacterium]|nr:ATP-binding protein [Burkholderiaceae bacterium]